MEQTDGEILLEMNHVKKSFDGNGVLEDISLTVKKGEVVSIIGPSGSGKSTLLRCATLLEKMDGGQLRLAVQHAGLRGLGNVHHTGLHDMLGGFVVFMPLYIVRDLLGGDLSVVGRQGNDLVAGGLDRAGFVAVDVTADLSLIHI